jgi:biopolymer transport protein ExbD
VLPPWVDQPQNQDGDKIKERNVLVVAINQHNNLLVNKEYKEMSDLRTRTKEFFDINNTAEHFPEKEVKDLPLLGPTNVNIGALVSLQNDRGTSYKVYIQAQNEIAAAINELRDEFCRSRFGSKFDDCTQEQQDVVSGNIYKMAISEAEPKDVSKTKKK